MLEIATTIFGLIQSVLILFKRKENWIFYLLNIITLIAFSFYAKLYGDVLENIIYLSIGLLGTLTWYSEAIEKKIFKGRNKHITFCNIKESLIYLLLTIGITAGVYAWLIRTDDPQPFMDALTTGLSFTATILMAFKKVQAWIYWFIADILMIIVYYSLEERAIYLALLNFTWTFLAVGTYINWRKEAKAHLNNSSEITEQCPETL